MKIKAIPIGRRVLESSFFFRILKDDK